MDFLSNFSSFIKRYWEVRNHMTKYKAFSFSSMGQYSGGKRLSSNKLQLLNFFIKEKKIKDKPALRVCSNTTVHIV